MSNTVNKELDQMKLLKDTYGSGSVADAYKANVDTIANAYANTVEKAEAALAKQKQDAETAYNKIISSYGAKAEKLRSNGFNVGTGGYSSFLDASAHQAKVATQNAAQSAYDTAIKDAEIAKQDKLNANKVEYDSIKNSAYASILEGVANGTYATEAQINAAKNAYKTLYGDLDETAINDAYTQYVASIGETVGADAYNQLTDDALKGAYKTNYLTNIGVSVPNIVATYVANGEADKEAMPALTNLLGDINKITDATTKLAYVEKVIEALKPTNIDLTNTASADNYYKLIGKAMESLDDEGKTMLVNSISENFKNGADFSYLGLGAKQGTGTAAYDSEATNKDGVLITLDNGKKYKIKVDNTTTVDKGTEAILDTLVKDKVAAMGENDSERGYAVAFAGKIYFHTPNGWKQTTNRRSEAEINYLKSRNAGDHSEENKK